MEKDPLLNQDFLKTRILAFLADHFDHCFTIGDLAGEQSVSGSVVEIQARIEVMLEEGLIKENEKDGNRCYQAVLIGKG